MNCVGNELCLAFIICHRNTLFFCNPCFYLITVSFIFRTNTKVTNHYIAVAKVKQVTSKAETTFRNKMSFWWKKNPKTSANYVKVLNEQLQKLQSSSISTDNKKKAQEECSRYLDAIKHILLDETTAPLSLNLLYDHFFKEDCLFNLMSVFSMLDFESRKNVGVIFSSGLGRSTDNKSVYVDYLISNRQIIDLILKVLQEAVANRQNGIDIYLCVGGMVDECLKFEQLCRIILQNPIVWLLFDNCLSSAFEISTQSFQLLHALFTSFPRLISVEFFSSQTKSNKFMGKLNKLLAHGSYVTKRQALKLLTALMLDSDYRRFMLSYIEEPENLKLSMILLSDKSKNLQLEAFQTFKVFMANPRKSKGVTDILIKNREQLLKFFAKFGEDSKDEIFQGEKNYLVGILNDLPRLITNPSTGNSNHSSSPPHITSASPTSL